MRRRIRVAFEELVTQNKIQILSDKNELERIDNLLDKKMAKGMKQQVKASKKLSPERKERRFIFN